MENLKNVLTSKEAASYLGVDESTLRKARMNSNPSSHFPSPPYLKMGRSIRYLRADLDTWLEQFRIGYIARSGVEPRT